jgi:glucose/mannose-6-phosphate isomerase
MAEAGSDGDDILETLLGLPDQVAEAREQAGDLSFPSAPDQLLFAGMGGSAIAGEYVAAWAAEAGEVPVHVVRGYDLPAWAGEGTLVAAVSYSGNTEETLSCFVEAGERGARRAAVTSGGRLAELAGDDIPALELPAGHEPRAAMGYLFGRAVEVAEGAGVLDPSKGLSEARKTLEGLRADVEPGTRAGSNPARRLAEGVEGRIPVVYGAGLLAPVARRLAGQLNENAEHLALHGTVPEMNHNDVVGWRGLDGPGDLAAVLLRDPEEHGQVAERFGFLADLLEDEGVPTVTVEARGSAPPARLLSATLVADAGSVYLARRKGVDPFDVAAIDELKERLAETGFRDRLVGGG